MPNIDDTLFLQMLRQEQAERQARLDRGMGAAGDIAAGAAAGRRRESAERGQMAERYGAAAPEKPQPGMFAEEMPGDISRAQLGYGEMQQQLETAAAQREALLEQIAGRTAPKYAKIGAEREKWQAQETGKMSRQEAEHALRLRLAELARAAGLEKEHVTGKYRKEAARIGGAARGRAGAEEFERSMLLKILLQAMAESGKGGLLAQERAAGMENVTWLLLQELVRQRPELLDELEGLLGPGTSGPAPEQNPFRE